LNRDWPIKINAIQGSFDIIVALLTYIVALYLPAGRREWGKKANKSFVLRQLGE